MSQYEIFVGTGAKTARGPVTAVAIASKQPTYLLHQNGQIAKLEGVRVEGVGHKKYFTSQGYVKQKEGTEYNALLRHIAVAQGRKMVEESIAQKAALMQKTLANQEVVVVPMFEDNEEFTAKVDMPRGYSSQIFSSSAMITDTPVRIVNVPGSPFGLDAGLTQYWIKAPGSSEPTPQVNEFGGIVENAIFTVVNSGLVQFYSDDNLHLDMCDETEDADTCRGYIKLNVTDSPADTLTVGISALDEVTVVYRKGTDVVVKLNGVAGPRFDLGAVVGTIASALVLAKM